MTNFQIGWFARAAGMRPSGIFVHKHRQRRIRDWQFAIPDHSQNPYGFFVSFEWILRLA